ncbi:hypothetical protein QBC46DRAFT_306047 [Diplogelasinospora grovesii]|uniref:Zn(2)-C6 fungal-type domain-containing protein n=1 Tax=Diplogelasinospora grovesii TaxID=303347 RepID=A0AAN6NGW7_9PEZI|nr:hypothetical protein QBC46DRAFT_306047 [Diplogelasinospora grovesii]
MVNTGQPSKACRTCLERKLKCDESKPVCRKCLKYRRPCRYRDPFEIRIRDETQSTVRKAQGKTRSPDKLRHDGPPEATILPTLQVPLDEQAQCFFLANFVPAWAPESNPGSFNFILPFLRSSKTKDPMVSACWTAASIATLAGRPNSRALLSRARTHYHLALAKLNKALADPIRARGNDCLLSVILLSIYEGFAGGDDVLVGWKCHMSGAQALIRLRGFKDVVSTPEGIDMFLYVRAVMIRHYTFRSSDVPSANELQWWAGRVGNGEANHAALLMNMKTVLLKAEAAAIFRSGSRTPQSVERSLELHRKCKETVANLGSWLKSSPPKWQAAAVHTTDEALRARTNESVEPPGGRCHTYSSVWVAAKRVNCSASRILLTGIMIRCLRRIYYPADCTATPDYTEAVRIGEEEVDNIVAGIPYFFNWTGDSATTPFSPCGNPTAPKGLAGLFCIWPLTIAASSEFATENKGQYIRRHLLSFSEATGSKHAELFSRIATRYQA